MPGTCPELRVEERERPLLRDPSIATHSSWRNEGDTVIPWNSRSRTII